MRALAAGLAAILVLIGVALIDRGRGPDPLAVTLGAAPEAEASPEVDDAADLGDTSYLASCLGDALVPGDIPPVPPLSPAGVERIAERMEEVRELSFDGAVDAEFLTRDEMRERVAALVDRDFPESLAQQQEAVLRLLGVLEERDDLLELTRGALSSQVLGLFLPPSESLLVLKAPDPGALEQITLAHEVEHALANDALGLPIPSRARPGRSDRDLAAQALVEGDATLSMELYALRYISLQDQLDIADDPAVAGDAGLEDMPHLLRRQLLFPYGAGLRYACELYDSGGWAAVDRAYDRPPRSTAELLDEGPGRLPLVDPPPAGELPPPWRPMLSGQIGAAELSWLFEAPGDDVSAALPDPEGAAADWRGGRFRLWQDDAGLSALSISLAEDPDGDLCGAMTAWYGAGFPDAELEAADGATTFSDAGQSASIACSPGEVRVGIAPDAALAADVRG